MSDAYRCACCGAIIPEGSHVCPNCKVAVNRDDSIDAYEYLAKYMKENMPKKERESNLIDLIRKADKEDYQSRTQDEHYAYMAGFLIANGVTIRRKDSK